MLDFSTPNGAARTLRLHLMEHVKHYQHLRIKCSSMKAPLLLDGFSGYLVAERIEFRLQEIPKTNVHRG